MKKFKNLLCRTLCVLLLNQILINNVHTIAIGVYDKNIYQYGKIIETFKGSGPLSLYCIQDMHCNTETQENIYKILKNLKKKHKHELKVIGVEGGFGKVDANLFSYIPDPSIKQDLVNKLVAQCVLTGAEKFKILETEDIALHGLENKKEYYASFMLLNESSKTREEIEHIFEKIAKSIKRGKEILYNDKLKSLDALSNDYKKDQITFSSYVTSLLKEASTYNIKTQKYIMLNKYKNLEHIRQAIDSARLHQETNILSKQINNIHPLNGLREKDLDYYKNLNKILKTNNIKYEKEYPTVARYMKYLDIENFLNHSTLLNEIDALFYEIYKLLAKGTGDPEELVEYERSVNLLKEYIKNDLSIYNTEEYERLSKNLDNLIYRIGDKLSKENYLVKNITLIKKLSKAMKKFYYLAKKRDEILVNNMLHIMTNASNENAKEKTPHKIGVMIFGGFHTKGVTNILKAKGITYAIIRPNINAPHDKSIYLQKLKEQEAQGKIST